MHVELDGVDPEGDRFQQAGKRILRGMRTIATMANDGPSAGIKQDH